MAKKNNDNNDEKVRLALDEHRWINTPVIYTTHGSSFTRFQQDVMLQVSGKLQDHFSKYLDEERYKDKERPKSPISKEDLAKGLAPIRLEMKDLNVGDSHYGDVNKMLDALTKLFVYAPVYDKETGLKKGNDYMPIFSKIFIPESYTTREGEDYAYAPKIDKDGNSIASSRRDGYVDVTINMEVAAYAFDMDQGYFNHLERIALFCNSAFTSRLYLLLMKYVSRGMLHPAIDYRELKDFLGMYERKEKSDVILREKYEKFSQFRKLVLDVARRDMERLCDENKIEIMLACTDGCKEGYEPIYRGSTKRGNPEKIKFHIKRTPLGVARELELHRGSSEQRLCSKLLDLYPTIDELRMKQFLAEVPEDVWNEFKKFAYSALPKSVEQPHRWDGTPEDYVFFLMMQWIKQKSPKPEPQQTSLNFNEPQTASWLDQYANPTKRVGQQAWEKMCAECTTDNSRQIFSSLQVVKIEHKAIYLTGKEDDIQKVENLLLSKGKSGSIWILKKLTEFSNMEIKGIKYKSE